MKDTDQPILHKDGVSYVLPFILVTCCFALWGFANDITNPMVKAFSKIFRMSVTDGALVQVAFYGGYFAMAFPAAMFIRKYSYKAGILLGLGLYAVGALLFFPAKMTGSYYPFLLAYFILTCGLSFLETSSNPYILSMGTEATATRRLNLAQSFNPMGSLLGMYVAMNFIQAKLNPMDTAERAQLNPAEFAMVRDADLSVLIAPYLTIGIVILVMLLVIRFTQMPKNGDQSHSINFGPTLKRIFSIHHYREGVVAQFFYVGAQIMCWTFIIQYGTRLFMSQGMDEKSAEVLSQQYNIIAMVIFCISRFICTFILRYLNAGKLLMILAIFGGIFTLGVIFLQNIFGMYCLVAVSACMSLMFPTIYGIALKGMGDDAKFGAAGLIMAILGGSVLPPLQASIIDLEQIAWLPAVNVSFILPFICFLVIIGLRLPHSEKKLVKYISKNSDGITLVYRHHLTRIVTPSLLDSVTIFFLFTVNEFIKNTELEDRFFQFPFYLAEKAGRKEKAMQIRDGPKENCREKSDHERRTCTWKKTGRKDGWRVRWLLLCAALRSCRRELLQYPPLRWEAFPHRARRRSRYRQKRRQKRRRRKARRN